MLDQDAERATSYLAAMMDLRKAGSAETEPSGQPAPRRRSAGVPRVSVVIPTKNEVRNIPGVLAELPDGLHEVILIDADSDDGTVETARRIRPDIRVVRQTRRGKGNALVCGFSACTGDVTVMLDADGSADPSEIPTFVDALVSGADFAKGSRFLPGGGSTDLTALRRMGNGVLNFVMNKLYGTAYTDLCYGYNAFWTRCVDRMALPSADGPAPAIGDGFEIETLLTARVAAARLKVVEVPSFERDRWFGESNLNTWRDGWRVLRTIVRERRRRTPRTASRRRPTVGLPDAAGRS